MRLLPAVAAAAALWFSCAEPVAAAETVLLNTATVRLTLDARGGRRNCTLNLKPHDGGEASGPRIVLRSAAPRARTRLTTTLGLSIEPFRGASQTVWVAGDQRRLVLPPATFDLTGQRRPVPFQELIARRDVHVTSRMADGTYRSARFRGADMITAFGRLYRDCGVDTQRLDAVAGLFAAEERRLALTPQDLRRMTLVLHGRYDNGLEPPAVTGELAPATRDLLERFSRDSGLTPTRYLYPALLRRLKAAKFKPRRWTHRKYDNFRRLRDWYVYTQGSGRNRRCVLETEALRATGALIWRYPHMRFSVRARERRGTMYVDLLTPNILRFRGGVGSTATVDGRRWGLAQTRDAVLPVKRSGEFAAGFVTAVRRGQRVVVTGSELDSGQPVAVEFSARGFTAGFNALMVNCNRPDLKAWL